MEQDARTYTLRARAAQLLTWLTSVQQQERQQHIVQADRLTNDGADRGIDDPDNRRQQQWETYDRQQATRRAQTQDRPATPDHSADRLAAQVDALHHQFQARQQATRQQGRGQSRGW